MSTRSTKALLPPDALTTWAEVDLDALAANVHTFKRHVGRQVEIIAVVKANAYGHGAAEAARAFLSAGTTRLAVHRVDEGVELRRAGITAPILVMGYAPVKSARAVVSNNLTPTVTTLEFAEKAAALARKPLPIHIKVDTGMGRYGLLPEEVVDFALRLQALSPLFIEGIFTHFATADSADRSYMLHQLAVFRRVLDELESQGLRVPLRHACNSAAAMVLPEAHFEAVRPGVALYGLHPSGEWAPPFPLKPVLALKSRVARVRTLPPGSAVGYGKTYITHRPTRVALVPVGYGDGYHRLLSNRGSVLVREKRTPILGLVSMDQIVVDVSSIPGVDLEDEVTLLGRQGSEAIRAEEIARWARTINYEVTTALLPRVTRIYLQGGAVTTRDN